MTHISIKLTTFVLLGALVLTGCDTSGDKEGSSISAKPDTASSDTSGTLATVNGVDITRAQLADHIQKKSEAQPGSSQTPEDALQELISVELLHQEAIRNGFDKKPEVIAEARTQTRNLIVDAYVLDAAASANFTDDQLRTEYDEKVSALPKYEHHASHILVKTEQEAKDIISALEGGADFEKLAGEKSIDPTASRGGDLGWFKSSHMVNSFGDAVEALEVGQTTKEPVESQFGWHVIRLVDRRESQGQVPQFEQVKDRMRAALVGEMIQTKVEELRAKANISMGAAP